MIEALIVVAYLAISPYGLRALFSQGAPLLIIVVLHLLVGAALESWWAPLIVLPHLVASMMWPPPAYQSKQQWRLMAAWTEAFNAVLIAVGVFAAALAH
jgi:hypothetical protein